MEQVFVVNADKLTVLTDNKTGFLKFDEQILDLIKTNGFFMDRDKAENDETKKQIIPYCMIVNGNKILAVKRRNPGESRLKNMMAIGIGGHINPEDSGAYIVFNAAMRELKEETDFDGTIVSQAIGFLSLDDTPVSRVHFGVVYRVDVDREVRVIDEGLEGSFVDIAELPKLADKMEGWSKVLAGNIIDGRIRLV